MVGIQRSLLSCIFSIYVSFGTTTKNPNARLHIALRCQRAEKNSRQK